METKNLPVAELQRLLAGVSEHGAQHLLEVEADLMQTAYLLSEAIEKLSASFMQIHASIAAQQQELDGLVHTLPAEAAQKVQVYREQIGQEINTVVTGLQFQDLTSQLIARTVKRVNGLRDVLADLTGHEDMPSAHEHEAVARLLEKINRNLSTRSGELQDGLRKEVNQKHMDSGEIELF